MLNPAQVPSNCVPRVIHNMHTQTPEPHLPVTSPESTILHQLTLSRLGPVLAWSTQVCEGEILGLLHSVSHTLSRPTPAFFTPPGPGSPEGPTSGFWPSSQAPLPSVSSSTSPPLEPSPHCSLCGLKYLLSRVQPLLRPSAQSCSGVYGATVF